MPTFNVVIGDGSHPSKHRSSVTCSSFISKDTNNIVFPAVNIFSSLLHVIDFHRCQIQLLTLSLASAISSPVKEGKVRVPDKNKTKLKKERHGRMPPVTGLMHAPVFKSKESLTLCQRLNFEYKQIEFNF